MKRRRLRGLAMFLAGVVGGTAFVGLVATTTHAAETVTLHRDELVQYCRLFTSGGELGGGAGGALSWRCMDRSDPAFIDAIGLLKLASYCADRHGRGWTAMITNLRSADGWSCATTERARREPTVAVRASSAYPSIGKRYPNGTVVPVVDSPHLFLDAEGIIELRRPTTLRAFCAEPLDDDDAPPLMFGVIAPDGQRGFVRSDYTDHPDDTAGLAPCS